MLLEIEIADFYKLKRHFWQDALIHRYKNDGKRVCGIYALFYKDIIVYIGQSQKIHHRILQHKQVHKKLFTHYAYQKTSCNGYKLAAYESVAIDYYRPIYNTERKI